MTRKVLMGVAVAYTVAAVAAQAQVKVGLTIAGTVKKDSPTPAATWCRWSASTRRDPWR